MQLIDNDTPNRRIFTLSGTAHAGRPQKARAGAGKRVSDVGFIAMIQHLLYLATALLLSFSTSLALAQLDEPLQQELLRLTQSDQADRYKMQQAMQQYGSNSPEAQAIRREQEKTDAKNLQRLKEIVDKHGWPGHSLVGPEAENGAFLILQHADHDTQVEYLPLVRRAVETDELPGKVLAYLQDRILVSEGKKQIYGTQLNQDYTTGELELLPIENEEQVDMRRAELGMQPLAEYLKAIPQYLRSGPVNTNPKGSK